MSETKFFEELLCLDIFQKEGGGGLPTSKLIEEFFCLYLDIFQEGGGELPDSKNFDGHF